MPERLSLIGQRFSRLLVVGYLRQDRHGKSVWLCQCDCGNNTEVTGALLVRGTTRSCSCLQKEKASKHAKKLCQSFVTHGEARLGKTTVEYKVWQSMRNRCNDINYRDYERYGGRGIKVYPEWDRSDGYEKFLKYLLKTIGRRPTKNHSIDRIDNNGNYEPGNLRWATKRQQIKNRNKFVWKKHRAIC